MRATRQEILDFLGSVPNAQPCWVDVLYTAQVPLAGLDALVQTMMNTNDSPLRRAEESRLSKEIVNLNGVFGEITANSRGNGKTLIKVSGVVTLQEKLRLSALVDNFCQLDIRQNGRFGRNGHVVMNVARRCTAGYNYARLPSGCSVIEVGADIKHWITDVSDKPWEMNGGKYVSARPILNQRDVVRVSWDSLVKRILEGRRDSGSDKVYARALAVSENAAAIFRDVKVQDLNAKGEYLISNDVNYDIKFSDMPKVMAVCGAKAWYGTMLRVKGLSLSTRYRTGELQLCGVSYRVDWEKYRIDFRNPSCNAFGYSHDVRELIKYEQRNGFVWSTDAAHFVYSKGPETNDELLFFSVVRVAKAVYLQQPRYVEDPNAGMTRVKSVWAVGGWDTGLPKKFEPIEYVVDTLALQKVYERRRAMETKGDLATTMVLVKSTSVRMWLNGVPVGTDKRILAALVESVAVTVETLVSQSRLRGNMTFEQAMGCYKLCMEKSSWFYNLLESVLDLRSVTGKITAPVTNAWAKMRGVLADAALSSMKNISVAVELIPKHVKLPMLQSTCALYSCKKGVLEDLYCTEPYINAYSALRCKGRSSCVGGDCPDCRKKADEFVLASGKGLLPVEPEVNRVSLTSTAVQSDSGVSDVASSHEWTEPGVLMADETQVDKGWRDKADESLMEYRSMEELIALEDFLRNAVMSEVRIDANRILKYSCITKADVLRHCTARTQHMFVRFMGSRLVETLGYDIPEFGAIYDREKNVFVPVTMRRNVATAAVRDGWYYTCNHLKVWNSEQIIAAISHALDYGHVSSHSEKMQVTLGVFGAGKTYGMMKQLADLYLATGFSFLVVSVTNKATDEAKEYGLEFGLPRHVVEARIKTVDSYLINSKFPADYLCVDEFTMAHFGKVDAIISITGAKKVLLYGDGRQIPYDPFTSGFQMKHSNLGGRIDESRVKFLPMTHRCNSDVCAMWLDVYPKIYPCDCCRVGTRDDVTVSAQRIGSIEDVKFETGVRYHGYTRAAVDQIAEGLRINDVSKRAKSKRDTGVVSVHEDQGSTHTSVHSIRLQADYDKNASARNPSLYNRPNYVLTDTSRHTVKYKYSSNSNELDLVRRRLILATDKGRLKLVKKKEGMGLTTVMDMLVNRYDGRISF